MDGLGLALDLDLAEVVDLERPAHEPVRAAGDEDRAGLGGGLHAGRDVHRVAQRRVLVAQVAADVADDDRPVLMPTRTWKSMPVCAFSPAP